MHLAIRIGFPGCIVYRVKESLPCLRYMEGVAQPTLNFTYQVIMLLIQAETFEKVVMVIVWLCSSYLAPGKDGEISPIEKNVKTAFPPKMYPLLPLLLRYVA